MPPHPNAPHWHPSPHSHFPSSALCDWTMAEASEGSDESYSDDVEEEIASDASLEEDLEAVDGDGEEEDYTMAVVRHPWGRRV